MGSRQSDQTYQGTIAGHETGDQQRESLETVLEDDPESRALSPENQHTRQESSTTSVCGSEPDPAWSAGFAPGELGPELDKIVTHEDGVLNDELKPDADGQPAPGSGPGPDSEAPTQTEDAVKAAGEAPRSFQICQEKLDLIYALLNSQDKIDILAGLASMRSFLLHTPELRGQHKVLGSLWDRIHTKWLLRLLRGQCLGHCRALAHWRNSHIGLAVNLIRAFLWLTNSRITKTRKFAIASAIMIETLGSSRPFRSRTATQILEVLHSVATSPRAPAVILKPTNLQKLCCSVVEHPEVLRIIKHAYGFALTKTEKKQQFLESLVNTMGLVTLLYSETGDLGTFFEWMYDLMDLLYSAGISQGYPVKPPDWLDLLTQMLLDAAALPKNRKEMKPRFVKLLIATVSFCWHHDFCGLLFGKYSKGSSGASVPRSYRLAKSQFTEIVTNLPSVIEKGEALEDVGLLCDLHSLVLCYDILGLLLVARAMPDCPSFTDFPVPDGMNRMLRDMHKIYTMTVDHLHRRYVEAMEERERSRIQTAMSEVSPLMDLGHLSREPLVQSQVLWLSRWLKDNGAQVSSEDDIRLLTVALSTCDAGQQRTRRLYFTIIYHLLRRAVGLDHFVKHGGWELFIGHVKSTLSSGRDVVGGAAVKLDKTAIKDAGAATEALFSTAKSLLVRHKNNEPGKRWLEFVGLANLLTPEGSQELLHLKLTVFNFALQLGHIAKEQMRSLDAESRGAMLSLREGAKELTRAFERMTDETKKGLRATVVAMERAKLWEEES
ncbi:MAG: hypothetical protein Q9174_005398 [Haloplaca sp. 1 TL-2023]